MDSKDHVFTVNRGNLVAPETVIAVASPPIIEFDRKGNVVNAWGNRDVLPDGLHGCFVDYQDNVWIAGNGDGIVQKYSHDGSTLLLHRGWLRQSSRGGVRQERLPVLSLFMRSVLAGRVGIVVLSALVAHVGWHWMVERGDVLWKVDWPRPDPTDLAMLARWVAALLLLGAAGWFIARRMGVGDVRPEAPPMADREER